MASAPQNRLLAALSAANRGMLLSIGVEVNLPVRTVAYRAEETPQYSYFLTSGIMSIVTAMDDGGTAEVGLLGREGVTGGLHLLGPAPIATDAFAQLDGTAIRVPFPRFQELFHSNEEIRDRVLEFVQEEAVSTSQIAACNRLHGAAERLARWLLMAQDRAECDVLTFTHEFLAMMLGARRTTVTLMAGELKSSGYIQYERGHIRIVDRQGLERAACDCYRVLERLHRNLYRNAWIPSDGRPAEPASRTR